MSKTLRRRSEVPQPVPTAELREPLLDRMPQWVALLLLGAVGLALWQLAVTLELVSRILLPGPSETFGEIVDSALGIVQGDHVFEALWITTQEVILGFIAAAASGLRWASSWARAGSGRRRSCPTWWDSTRCPRSRSLPCSSRGWGSGSISKIIMALFIAFFPVIVDTAAGLASVDRDAVMLFRSIGASRWQTLVKLKLPSALPFIFAGLKTAAVFSVVGAVVGEYLGGGGGLGELIRLSAQQLRIDRVFALIFYLSFIGLALFWLMSWLERRLVFGRKPEPIEITAY